MPPEFIGDFNMMHTCPPPIAELEERFEDYSSTNQSFGHILLLQKAADDGCLAAALKPYFESAHLDARSIFHEDIGIDLHPDAGAGAQPAITYPGCLPSTTRRGLFGEVLSGLLAESYEFVGEHEWCVPVFLFRHHEDAFQYLYALARHPDRERQTIGRLGSDFIGLAFDDDGEVIRVISGEAKWRETLSQGVVNTIMLGKWIDSPGGEKVRSGKGVWYRVNTEPEIPSGVRQLQRLLQKHDPEGYDAAILSLQRALVAANSDPIPKTDLVVIAGNARKTRDHMECLLPYDEPPDEYEAGNDLQLVEVLFKDGEKLIDSLYASLWKGGQGA